MKPLIVIGSDHGGFATKKHLVETLTKQGYTILDIGGFSPSDPDDYPDFAVHVAKAVAKDRSGKTKGVLICGSGTGMVMAANKVKGIRAAVAYDQYSAKMARHDNDANIIALRGRKMPAALDAKLVHTFLTTPFSGFTRHKRRIQKIARLERTK